MDIHRYRFTQQARRMLNWPVIAWILAGAGASEVRAAPASAAHEASAAATPGRPTLASLAPSGRGLGARRAYLALAPGIAGIGLNRSDYFRTAYLWGIDAGYHFPLGRTFKVQPGGFFEHSPLPHRVLATQYDSQLRHWLRMGPQVRVGGGNDRVFGYALLALIVDVFVEDTIIQGPPRRQAHPLAHAGVGAGAQGLLGKRVLLGGEGSLDVVGVSPYMRLRLYVGVVF
ncbi:MAG: hypothetical protein IPO88_20165 [Nannocystis sp.]|uniref:hypothetical protein n=1 Tax=Nannocystis sp. TaxID=1962667 RepID=UPI002429CF1D|nr:hypothetical protein [Nannocystis sp.]MBK9755779.1 hypothetical protein [Nannocystis sp.]